MWYMYTMEYSSVIKNIEIMPLAPIWMDMEIIILREVKEKDKYSIVWKVKKKNTQMNLFIEQKRTHRLRECSYGYQRGNVGGRDRLTFESI